jgi:anti-anti-sigma factor
VSHDAPPIIGTDLHEDSGWTVVRIRGVVDCTTAPLLRRPLLEAARRSTGVLVVDLAETSFLDCRGMAVLAAARDVLPTGHELRLRGARGVVRRALMLTDLGVTMERTDHRSDGHVHAPRIPPVQGGLSANRP